MWNWYLGYWTAADFRHTKCEVEEINLEKFKHVGLWESREIGRRQSHCGLRPFLNSISLKSRSRTVVKDAAWCNDHFSRSTIQHSALSQTAESVSSSSSSLPFHIHLTHLFLGEMVTAIFWISFLKIQEKSALMWFKMPESLLSLLILKHIFIASGWSDSFLLIDQAV